MLHQEETLSNVRVSHSTFLLSSNSVNSCQIDYSRLPDKVLWNAFKNGDELAFIRIYKSYFAMLYNYGCKYSEDKEMVKDCLHDFFIYLRKNRLGFGDTNSIRQYLFKAFRRRVIEYNKKKSCEYYLHEPSDYAQSQAESSIEAIYINNQVKAEQLKKLSKGLNALDCKEREAIHCFYFEGLSYEQIAEAFNFSHVSSARRVIYRGLKQLRNFF